MLTYARIRGLKRGLITFPGIPVSLMARIVGWMTPVPRPIAYALIEGLAADSIVQHDEARRVFPNVKLISYEEATREALADLSPTNVERVLKASNARLRISDMRDFSSVGAAWKSTL